MYWYCNNTAAYCNAVVASQLKWLEADLAAVDRSVTPWVFVSSQPAPCGGTAALQRNARSGACDALCSLLLD